MARGARSLVAGAVQRALGSAGTNFLAATAVASLVATSALAQEQESVAQSDVLGEITVTGTRIVRDGYEAPTPVTVIGEQQINAAPMQHISEFVNRLPSFAGGLSTTSGGNQISDARQSQNNLNLRGLDVFRTLVLLDGRRIVAGDINGAVNINDLPQSLISRVDVITGGASAAYGSDALSGVVNFVLDKDFTGLKADVQGGTTKHGDNDSYKVSLTAGTPFADGRGHLTFSGEYARNDGLFGAQASRNWGFDTVHILANPEYNPATGSTSVPAFIVRGQASTLLATPGGIITSGPLRGTDFSADGSPRMYRYGELTNSQFNVGGDWKYSDVTYYNQTLANRLARKNAFARLSFELTDNVEVFFNYIYAESNGVARSKLDDSLGNITIHADNPYLDQSIAQRMADLGLSTFTMGSFNLDMPYIATDAHRMMNSIAGGLEGSFDAFGTPWRWDVYAQFGQVHTDFKGHVMNRQNFATALDSVRTADGQIVCRVNADASTENDVPACVPWNPFGWGNNGPTAVAFSKGLATLDQKTTQRVLTAGFTGDPFDTWAGPVSTAAGIEWRDEEVEGTPDPLSVQSAFSAGNYKGAEGKYNVKEVYFETVVPLAKNQSWARELDFNAAVRYTDYSTSGNVTTWKAGLIYSPIDDLRFRATRSRDIRAPNLEELFARGGGGQSPGILDPWNNNAPLPTFLNATGGNPDLQPEEADTTGLGVVLQPSFLPGFSVSVDYYDINVKGAIDTIDTQQILNRCHMGQTALCDAIIREPSGQIFMVLATPFNLASLHQRGWDIETSYSMPLLGGELNLRALGTHVEFSKRDDGVAPVRDNVGDNANVGPLKWRGLFSAGYSLGPVTATWTGRYMSSGHLGALYVECKADCPPSTTYAQTIDHNYVASRFYHDLSLSYELEFPGGTSGQLYLNVQNVADKQPPAVAKPQYWYMPVNPQLYDTIGRQFFAGIRFRM